MEKVVELIKSYDICTSVFDIFGDIWGRGSVFKKSVVVLQTFVKLMGLVISDYVRNRWSTQMSTPKPPPPAPPNTRFLRNPQNPVTKYSRIPHARKESLGRPPDLSLRRARSLGGLRQ